MFLRPTIKINCQGSTVRFNSTCLWAFHGLVDATPANCSSKRIKDKNHWKKRNPKYKMEKNDSYLIDKTSNFATSFFDAVCKRFTWSQAVCVTTHKGSWVKLLLCLISILTRTSSHLVREMNQTQGSKHCCLFRKTLRKRAISRNFKIS